MKFDIVTYCGVNYAEALRFTLPSWLNNSGCSKIIVYTDCQPKDFVKAYDYVTEARRSGREIVEGRCIHPTSCSDAVASWDRKIDVLEHDFALRDAICPPEPPNRNWIWLDSDCYTVKDCHALFHIMEPAHVAATRAIGRTLRGRGQANAGVIPFRYGPELRQFFVDWRRYAKDFRGAGGKAPITNQNMYYEQTAFSHLVLEAFDGRRPYFGAVISEYIWNCEEDSNSRWLANIDKFKPRIIHFKGRRWADKLLRAKALEAAKGAVKLLS